MCLPYMFFFEAAIDYYHDRWNATEYFTKYPDLKRYPSKQVHVISFSAIDQTPYGADFYNKLMSVHGIISGQGIREKVVWKFLSEDFVVIQIPYGTERRNQHVQEFVSN